jgi:tetratricopeptide (TPR) repeat protein
VALCGHLPLAIALLARLFTRHQSWTMAHLITETRARLLTVTAEDRTVAAAFELSYRYLDAGRQRFFRYLGLHPGADIDPYAAAALTGLPLDQAVSHLDGLLSARLLDEPVPRRYRMHDLIRQYARGLAAGEADAARDRGAGRLLDYYQYVAQAADLHLSRHTRPADTSPVPVPAAVPDLPGWHQADAWLTAEQANLMDAIGYAAGRHPTRVAGLTAATAGYLRSRGPWPQAIILHTAAAQSAEALGDQPGQASALYNLGDIQCMSSNYPAAADALEQALGISRSLGDRVGEANALSGLGIVRQQSGGGLPAAAGLLEQALAIFTGAGDRVGEANALSSLGAMRRLAGDYPAATGLLEQALGIFRGISSPAGEANVLRSLAGVRQLTGDYPGATSLMEQALAISRASANGSARRTPSSDSGRYGNWRAITRERPPTWRKRWPTSAVSAAGSARPTPCWASVTRSGRMAATRRPPVTWSKGWASAVTSVTGSARRTRSSGWAASGGWRVTSAAPLACWPSPWASTVRSVTGAVKRRCSMRPGRCTWAGVTPRRPARASRAPWSSPAARAPSWRKPAPWREAAGAPPGHPAPVRAAGLFSWHWTSTSASAPRTRSGWPPR